jgi:teichuronic acid biosynthesis glycosyltransferase TuaC
MVILTNDHAVRRVLAVTNLYPTEHAPESGTFVKSQIEGLRDVGVDVRVLHVDRDKEGRSAYRKLKARIWAALAAEPADVVHAMYGGVIAGIVVRATDLPTVVSICGSDILGSPAARSVDRLASIWSVRATRHAVGRADAMIAKSQNLREALPGELDPSRVFVIPNGLDRSLFKPLDQAECRRALGWDPDRCHIFFHITPDERKRHWLAREAVEWARSRGAPVELHEVTGVPVRDVPMWLNASDAVLNTALFEGSPNSIKEALACNTAVRYGCRVGRRDRRAVLSPAAAHRRAACHRGPNTRGNRPTSLEGLRACLLFWRSSHIAAGRIIIDLPDWRLRPTRLGPRLPLFQSQIDAVSNRAP